ncbi:peptide/nickel transport system permease protein [Arthrobacter sp. V4I6]|uniref:dipeptide/oligopeptide/nickel ABC transporter permease/ATP-binding protein n=1 Tax=unclassified Arthrobacter TaxID=235627 RepID=UPI002785B8D3|nr:MULTISPECIES: dipeptide/oligopeptide/nickel ABC transporter permease/ATP-binding protein [unclassified Arthrobacter]MDQ0819486.1 peptide/nickel transport system permease protein [Arthrobacter sp. V1I7]MDQ0853668.1 peptide/nickel transport system permease protein [Arthrobacter sp. V4I6]
MSLGIQLEEARGGTKTSSAVASPQRQSGMARVWGQGKGKAGLTIVIMCILLAVLGRIAAPFDPYEQDLASTLSPPGNGHIFGTDQLGRDVFSRILAGALTSLGIGLGGVAIAAAIGIPLGVLAGYLGKKFDFLLMRVVDIMLSFPDIIFALAIVAILGANTQNVILAVGVVSIPIFARTARAVTMSTKAEPFIEGSVSLGCTPARVVIRHIMPNILGTMLTLSSLLFATTLLTSSGLGFLGLGVQPPEPEWGTMLGEARSYIRTHSYMATFPGLFLAISALGFNLLGEAMRAVYDPTFARKVTWRARRAARQARLADKAKAAHEKVILKAAAEPEASEMLHVRDLRVRYLGTDGPVEAIHGVSLKIQAGRTLAIVGESGSGKSTLLRAISTLLPKGKADISGGSVRIGGTELVGASADVIRSVRMNEIGIVFQDPASALNPVLSIGAQLIEAVNAGGKTSRAEGRRKAIELLDAVSIPDPAGRLDMYPHQFSGGMKQRIVIAMALAQDPSVLLADEPTSALDVTIQQQILTLLRRLQSERDIAILLVTHDLGLVARYADDVAVMYGGNLVETGSVAEVFKSPRHPYTAALISSVPTMDAGKDVGLRVIHGDPPSLVAPPKGCVFNPRCPLKGNRSLCTTEPPVLRAVEPQHLSACHFSEEIS